MKFGLLNTMPSLLDDFNYLLGTTASSDYFLDEDEGKYYLTLDLPGIKKEELKVEIKEHSLIIEAESKGKRNRRYHRVFSLPNIADLENIEADLKEGVLTLSINKKKEKTKLIQIK